ncbi:MAG: sterol desaturase family protein [bacterium]|nr:sterol desaturase family protein [bacterium]
MASAIRYGFCPLILIGFNGVGLTVIANGAALWWLPVILGCAIALSFGAERLLPYEEDWNRSHDDADRDILHALVNEVANFGTLLLLPVFTSLLAIGGIWPEGWPFVLQVLLAVLVADAGIALAHYASHRLDVLWRFHAVHHSVKRMYGFNGLMKHPVHQAIETVVGTTPLVLMGLPPSVATALVFCVAVQLLLQHSNVDYSVGPLRYVLAVSEVHRFHHQKDANLGDVNFGLFTTLVDHALGTFHYEQRETRFTSEELGIGAEPDYPSAYLSQLAEPFRARPRDASAGSPA